MKQKPQQNRTRVLQLRKFAT